MGPNIKQEFIRQYNHAFSVLIAIVEKFDKHSWSHTGRKNYTPDRLSYHILHSIKYYIEDTTILQLKSGKNFEIDWEKAPSEELLSQNEIIACIKEIQKRTNKWLEDLECEQKNTSFEWAGEIKIGIVIFSLKHFMYHLGELSCLLNESKNGEVNDIYVSV